MCSFKNIQIEKKEKETENKKERKLEGKEVLGRPNLATWACGGW
jgi:hypothetical protein